MNSLELKVPPMALALVMALAMGATALLFPDVALAIPWGGALGTLVTTLGLLLILAAGARFRARNTTVNPTTPDATTALVVSGVYRLSRNPMYVGALAVLGGWALVLSHPAAFLFLPAFVAYMNRYQIAPEERALSAKFGEAYLQYTKTVRRWL